MSRILMLLACLSLVAVAQNNHVEELAERCRQARPGAEELAFYSLDWAPSLEAALERAAQEQRPVFFIHLTNISGPTEFFSGHC